MVSSAAWKRVVWEEDGQTLVEYGLLISLIAVVVLTTITLLGSRVHRVFEVTKGQINTST